MPSIQRHRQLAFVFPLTVLSLAWVSCDQGVSHGPVPQAPHQPVTEALEIAEAFVDGYYQDFTDPAYDSGYTDLDYSRLVDHSLDALATWQEREDAWLRHSRLS